jgi:hypothetical protein
MRFELMSPWRSAATFGRPVAVSAEADGSFPPTPELIAIKGL